MAVMNLSSIIRSFHRWPNEPNGCVMPSDLPWMSEPSELHFWHIVCLVSVVSYKSLYNMHFAAHTGFL